MLSSTKTIFSRIFTRNFKRSPVVRDDCISDCGGLPGSNLPFDISNKYKLTAHFLWFFGVGLAAPALLLRHLMLKNAGDGSAQAGKNEEEEEGEDDK